MIPALLRLLGYDAYGLRYGISAWNRRLNVWPLPGSIYPYPVATGGTTNLEGIPDSGPDTFFLSAKRQIAHFFEDLNHRYPPGFRMPWTITPATLSEEIHSSHPPTVVDVRNAQNYQSKHIPGSINIPFALLGSFVQKIPKNKPVVFVSQTMQTSAQACALFRLMGYQAYNLQQGLVAWNPSFSPPMSRNLFPVTPTKD